MKVIIVWAWWRMLTAESMERKQKTGWDRGDCGRIGGGYGGWGILRCPVHYWMCWATRAPEADVKRKIPVVLLEVQEAKVCTPCHYTGFEDAPDWEKRLHIKTQLRGLLQTTYTVRTNRGKHTACFGNSSVKHLLIQPTRQIMLIDNIYKILAFYNICTWHQPNGYA